jgi:uncharacterized membrane protein
MTTHVARHPWPAAAPVRASWRFGEAWPSARHGHMALRWVLRRNCSLTPRQVFGAYLLLCLVSLLIAGGFSWWGATPVLAFAGVELLLAGLALLVYARHATDRETILLDGPALRVEHHCGRQVQAAEFRSAWVRVEPRHGEGSLVELTGEGQQARVGRYLRPELRSLLAQELRRALRGPQAANDLPAGPRPANDPNTN